MSDDANPQPPERGHDTRDRLNLQVSAEPGTDERDESSRRLFRYVTADEWHDYRAIMTVFAGTFFSEFSPDDVATGLMRAGHTIEPAVVPDRLESLRRWGNLTVSSSVGNPSNLRDYYKRRNRYLITRVGQEIHELVEGVLNRVDEVRDVSTGRLRSMRDALATLQTLDLATIEPEPLADAVRAVFDPHAVFTTEITQFFVAINQWQSRYDLPADEFRFFAEVLVGYVADRLDEIERMSLPIGRRLTDLSPSVPTIVQRMSHGLAAQVKQAGLEESITVTHTSGSTSEDWDHLMAWFVRRGSAPSRIEQLRHDALAAIRTLTLNLTRLSRVGVGASSRRADFLRLATFFDRAGDAEVHQLAAAAFGLYPSSHFGILSEDSGDPVATSTSWWEAPRAPVPISIRERGDTNSRGRPTPMTDQSQNQRLLRYRREQEFAASQEIDAELLAAGTFDGTMLSAPAMARLQQLLGRTTHRLNTIDSTRESTDGGLRCIVARRPGRITCVSIPEGTLTIFDLDIHIVPAVKPSSAAGLTVVALGAGS